MALNLNHDLSRIKYNKQKYFKPNFNLQLPNTFIKKVTVFNTHHKWISGDFEMETLIDRRLRFIIVCNL